jgi:hypothetical protein
MEALHEMGVPATGRNFVVVSDGPLSEDGRPVLVLAKRSAFTDEEEARVTAHLAAHPNLVLQYRPSQPGANAFSRLIASNDPAGFARSYDFNVAPVSDNAPFFFFTLKLGQIVRGSVQHGMDWRINLGVAVLGVVLILSIVAVLAFLIVPMLLRTGHSQQFVPLLYFVGVGLGYILVEIAFIQRFVLFLGHPTYALTVVVFLMLLSSGAGSLFSRRWITRPGFLPLVLATVSVAIGGYVLLLPRLLPSAVGLSFPVKLVLSGVLLIPLGFAMGMPFPAGLRALGSTASAAGNSIEWAWAVNAASSVLGSVLAIVIALQYGLSTTLACGAIAYAIAICFTQSLVRA